MQVCNSRFATALYLILWEKAISYYYLDSRLDKYIYIYQLRVKLPTVYAKVLSEEIYVNYVTQVLFVDLSSDVWSRFDLIRLTHRLQFLHRLYTICSMYEVMHDRESHQVEWSHFCMLNIEFKNVFLYESIKLCKKITVGADSNSTRSPQNWIIVSG